MVITSDSGPPLSSSRTLPLGLTSLTRSTEMLDVEIRARARTLPYPSTGDIPMFSRNTPSNFSVSYSSDKEEISFSKRYVDIYIYNFLLFVINFPFRICLCDPLPLYSRFTAPDPCHVAACSTSRRRGPAP